MPLTARYSGTCRTCRQPIAVGAEIADSGHADGLRWTHAVCAPDAAEQHEGAATSGALFAMDGAPSPVASRPKASTRRSTTRPPAGSTAAPAGTATVVAGALQVWTDGACSGNPGPGGWAWATRDGREGSGGAAHTTNQRMEIHAAAQAVLTLVERPIVVVSDSTYVVNCFRDSWWQGWLARSWTNSQKKPVANRELWEPLIEAYQQGGISFRWVKGHSGDAMNDLVDRLAVAAGQRQRA